MSILPVEVPVEPNGTTNADKATETLAQLRLARLRYSIVGNVTVLAPTAELPAVVNTDAQVFTATLLTSASIPPEIGALVISELVARLESGGALQRWPGVPALGTTLGRLYLPRKLLALRASKYVWFRAGNAAILARGLKLVVLPRETSEAELELVLRLEMDGQAWVIDVEDITAYLARHVTPEQDNTPVPEVISADSPAEPAVPEVTEVAL